MIHSLKLNPWKSTLLQRRTTRRRAAPRSVEAGLIEKLEQRTLLAAAGALDPTFNLSGKVTTAFGTGLDQANDIAVQSDGRILAVGFTVNLTDRDFAVARYTASGALDTSFNGAGKESIGFGTLSVDQATSVAVQSDGKIVIAGFSTAGLVTSVAVTRLNANGTLDTTFNGTGRVLTRIGLNLFNEATDVTIQKDGKIVVVGSSGDLVNQSFALIRYNANGSLDTSLQGTGEVTTSFGLGLNQANAVALQSDGKIVAAGVAVNVTNNDFALVRYNTNGSLDTSFDGDGRVLTNFGLPLVPDAANGVAIQADGKIVAAGFSLNGLANDFALARYNVNGSLDTSFNGTGEVLTPVAGAVASIANDVVIQADGKIDAGGIAVLSGTQNAFALTRYNTNGSLDASFGTGGEVLTSFGVLIDDANALALQPDGKILAAGFTTILDPNVSNFAVARYIGVDHPPVFVNLISPVTATAGTNLTFTVAATDPDGDPITYSVSNLPAGATFNTTTHVFSWTPTASQAPGEYIPVFKVSDGTLSTSKPVTIDVNAVVNQPPTLSPIGNKSVNVGNLLSFAISATDPENNPLTYSATGLPAGATFDPSTHVFSWTPTNSQGPGNYTVTFKVTDGTGSDSETIHIAVVGGVGGTNPPPVFNTVGPKTIGVNSTLTFTISATDPNGDPLTYSAANLPAGATFNPGTRVFTWKPTPAQGPGKYQVQFFVSDGTSSDSQTVPITVTGGSNSAPVFTAIPNKTIAVGSKLSFTVSATDPDGNPLTYSASNLPTGATFNTATHTFTWTPGAAQGPGSYLVTFSATDGGLSASTTGKITVTGGTNHAPTVAAIPNQTVTAGQKLTFTVSATDADGNPLTYTATNLPSGASFNPTTHVFTWTPTTAQAPGQYSPTFTVSDGVTTASRTPQITVNPAVTNHAPVLASIGNKSVHVGNKLTFSVSASDQDGDPLTFSASSLPAGASFNATTHTFTWTPANNEGPQVYSVTFTVSDGKAQDSETIQIAVSGGTLGGNPAPVFNTTGPKTVGVNSTLTFPVSATDPNGDPITYSASNLPAGATFNPGTHTFTWKPNPTQGPGSYQVQFGASDGTSTTTETVPITVTGGSNRAPVFNPISDQTVAVGSALNFTVSATDPDGNPLSYSAADLPAGATFNASTHAFHWVPTAPQGPGTYIVTFRTTDGGLSDTATAKITVTGGTNHAPTITPISDKTVQAGHQLTFTVSASDPEGSPVTYGAANLPAGATFNTTTHVFSWTPTAAQATGRYNPIFTASDGILTSSTSPTIVVTAVVADQPPVLNSIGNKTVNAGSVLTFAISGSDPEGDKLTFSASNLPAGATFNAASRTFSWTPTLAQGPGNYSVTFAVSDGQKQDSETIHIGVIGGTNGSNPGPIFTGLGPQTVAVNHKLTFTVSAIDPNGDPLTYSASNLPAGATFNTATHQFAWTPTTVQGPGVYSVGFHVSDGNSSDDMVVTVRVTGGTNHPPVFNPIGDKTVAAGGTLNFPVSATDPDGGTLTYSAQSLPPGATFDPTTHTFHWTPTVSQGPGNYPVTFAASDGGLTTTQTIHVAVIGGTNQPPVIQPISDQHVDDGHTITIPVVATDPDGNPLTFTVTDLPPGATFDPTTHVITYSPGASQSPMCFMPTVTVSDGGLTDSVSFEMLVSQNGQGPFVRLFRAYNPNIDLHFFTTSYAEFQADVKIGLRDESQDRGGIGVFVATNIDAAPLHRLYNANNGEHYYTLSDHERDSLVAAGWKFEKDEGFLDQDQSACVSPIYRLYNQVYGGHLFTENKGVRDTILAEFPGIWIDTALLGYGEILDPGDGYPPGVNGAPNVQQEVLDDVGSSLAPLMAANSGASASPVSSAMLASGGAPAITSNVNAGSSGTAASGSLSGSAGPSSTTGSISASATDSSASEDLDAFWTTAAKQLSVGGSLDALV